MKKIIISFLLLLPLVSNATRVNVYDTHVIANWQVFVDTELVSENPKVEKVGLRNLKKALEKINRDLPKHFIDFARRDGVKIFILPEEKVFNRTGMFFVPKSSGSFDTGLERIVNNAIVIVDGSLFMEPDTLLYYLIHELAHYRHLSVLGYTNESIYSKYHMAKNDKNYKIATYALNNHLEYFAELSAMFFTKREDLRTIDGGAFSLIEKLWATDSKKYDRVIKNTPNWKAIRDEELRVRKEIFPLIK